MRTGAAYDQLIADLGATFRTQRTWVEGRGLFLIAGHFLSSVAAGGWLFALWWGNRPAALADYRGKVVLLNVWATWCPPCRIEMPSMERLHKTLAGTDFRIVAVSVDEDDSTVVNAFVRELGLTFDILHDQTGAIQGIYQTTGVPESFVIDRDGVIVKKVIGAVEWDGPVNEALIRRLLDAR